MKVTIFGCFITTLIVGCFVSLIDGETVEKDIKKLENFFKDELKGIGVPQIDTSRIKQKDAKNIAKYGVHRMLEIAVKFVKKLEEYIILKNRNDQVIKELKELNEEIKSVLESFGIKFNKNNQMEGKIKQYKHLEKYIPSLDDLFEIYKELHSKTQLHDTEVMRSKGGDAIRFASGAF